MTSETNAGAEGQSVSWWTPPGETDTTAYAALILLFLLVFAIVHFYARFDRYAEEHNEGTPLKTTVPTLLMIAFAYEIFPPLSHFSILLPLALIATALARDLMLWFEPAKEHMLKGELEDVLLDELQHQHRGEHDHTGRRIPEEPKEKAVPDSKPRGGPATQAKELKAGGSPGTKQKKASVGQGSPVKNETAAKRGTESD